LAVIQNSQQPAATSPHSQHTSSRDDVVGRSTIDPPAREETPAARGHKFECSAIMMGILYFWTLDKKIAV
jgi:hypothetical protein